MKNIFLLIIIPALLFLGSCEENSTASVFDHNAALQGYVVFATGSPDSLSAEVTASRNNLLLAQTSTDAQGYYLLEGLSAGEYFIAVKLQGYASQSFMANLVNNVIVTADTIMLQQIATLQMATRIIDGNIDSGWLPVYTDDHAGNWGTNDFSELYLAYDEDYLYVAVTGQFSTSDNTVSILIDKDGSSDTGINDFSIVGGGDIGGRIRKTITAPASFGADIAFNSGWGLANGEGVVSLENPSAVDEALLEDVSIAMNGSTIEFAVSLSELYGGFNLPARISLVAYIGGGGDQYFANDVIPQDGGDFTGTFLEVFTIGFE